MQKENFPSRFEFSENCQYPIWNLKNVEIKFFTVKNNMRESIEIATNEEVSKGVKCQWMKSLNFNFKNDKFNQV